MKARRGSWLLVGVLAAAFHVGALGADEPIPLQKSDTYTVTSNQSSFTNMLDTAYGWDDPVNGKGAAPRADADYLVSGGKILCSPYDASDTAVIRKFDGRSLTFNKASFYIRTAKNAKLQIDDLRIVGSCTFNNNSWSYANTLLGALTLQPSSVLTLTAGGSGHYWYFNGSVSAASDAVMTCAGGTNWSATSRKSYVNMAGDCRQFFGTLKTGRCVFVNLTASQSDFPGNVFVENNAGFSVVANSTKTSYAMGDLVASNSVVTINASRTLKTRSLVSGGSETNNVIDLQSKAKLEVGDLTLNGTKINFAAGSLLTVTNSLKILSPVFLTVTTASEHLLMTVPVSAGKLSLGDFRMNTQSCFLRLVTEGGVQKLYSHLRLFDEKRGYVTLTRSEGSAPKNGNYILAYDSDGIGTDNKGWSERLAPHSKTNYYCQGVIRTKNSVFKGDSLTIGKDKLSQLRVISHFTVNDLRMVSPCEWSTSGSSGKFNCLGKSLTVGTTNTAPLVLLGGVNGQAYNIYSDLHGLWNAEIACRVASSTTVGDGRYTSVNLLGDNSDYFGTVWVDYQTTLLLGSSLPGTVILGSTNETQAATLAVAGAATDTVSIGTLASDVYGIIDVPAGKVLKVEKALTADRTLVKRGTGTLELSGAATAGTASAILRVEAGAVKPLSSAAVSALPIAFGAAGGVLLDWEPSDPAVAAKGLDLSASAFTVPTAGLGIAFDLGLAVIDRNATYVKALVTVKDADAAKLAGKLRVTRIPGHSVRVLEPVSAGGLTTFRASFEPTGFFIVVR